MIGFTFKNEHSSKYNVILASVDRTAFPTVKRREVSIPGRDGRYDFGDNKYDNRTIQINLFVQANSLQQLRQRVRLIAGWLSGKGELKFDDEQDKFYIAKIYNQLPLEQYVKNGEIAVIFECEPFAYSVVNTTEVTRTDDSSFFVFNNGSVETPAEYSITNNGDTAIQSVRIRIIQTQ